jgi:uncharacterized protein
VTGAVSATTDATTTDVIDEFFRRFGSGDRTGALALFADDVDFDVPGADFVPWTGTRSTTAQIDAFLVSAVAEVETQEFVIERTVADGEHAVVLGHFTHRVRRTDKAFTCGFALHIMVTDGLIRTYHMFENSYAIAEAFRE